MIEQNLLFKESLVLEVIYSQLSRCSTLWSSVGFSLIGPTIVKAHESFLFSEGSLKVENKEHLVDFVVTLWLL